ncbi:MAG: lasso peptide [Thermodesulfovibrionales bacterium]|jgi:hypothetical protein
MKDQAKKVYTAPVLTRHGNIEEVTQAAGLLLTDALLTGSVISVIL